MIVVMLASARQMSQNKKSIFDDFQADDVDETVRLSAAEVREDPSLESSSIFMRRFK